MPSEWGATCSTVLHSMRRRCSLYHHLDKSAVGQMTYGGSWKQFPCKTGVFHHCCIPWARPLPRQWCLTT